MFEEFDTDRSGKLEKDESFKIFNKICTMNEVPLPTTEMLNNVFELFDTNQSGTLNRFEIRMMVKSLLEKNVNL